MPYPSCCLSPDCLGVLPSRSATSADLGVRLGFRGAYRDEKDASEALILGCSDFGDETRNMSGPEGCSGETTFCASASFVDIAR